MEICDSNKRWYTVCGKYWTESNTAVVCRSLGYSDTIGGKFYQEHIELHGLDMLLVLLISQHCISIN